MRHVTLVCRVVAGRVAHGDTAELMDLRGAAAHMCMFDSVALRTYLGDDELVVFNPKAVLPCFCHPLLIPHHCWADLDHLVKSKHSALVLIICKWSQMSSIYDL